MNEFILGELRSSFVKGMGERGIDERSSSWVNGVRHGEVRKGEISEYVNTPGQLRRLHLS